MSIKLKNVDINCLDSTSLFLHVRSSGKELVCFLLRGYQVREDCGYHMEAFHR